ncbi:MAG: TIR domain-containing protein [Gammaproteobacteria bacterium]|nr:TIR domain-containing protein [Gammaproteobacteria bacterium]
MERPFPAYQGDEPYIFVSYAHEDDALVYSEIQWLHDQGFNIWYDEGISPGSRWSEELATSLQNSALFLYFGSPHSVDSRHCLDEINLALDANIPTIAVHLEETELTPGLQLRLSSHQAILKYDHSDQDYRDKLLAGIRDHVKQKEDLSTPKSGTATTDGDKNKLLFIGLGMIAVAILATGLLLRPLTQETAEDVEPSSDQPGESVAVTAEETDKSIAVLPFEDMSAAQDQAYLGRGIAEELINGLAKLDGLKVASRTSSFYYARQDLPITTIAERLNVRHVLEGSIRKAGNRVRITVQLIDAETDTHLLSETYDRDLEDLFAVQDEIAREVVKALRVELGYGFDQSITNTGTESIEAFEEYQKGVEAFSITTAASLIQAEKHLRRAIELDPGYTEPYLALFTVIGLANLYGIYSDQQVKQLKGSLLTRWKNHNDNDSRDLAKYTQQLLIADINRNVLLLEEALRYLILQDRIDTRSYVDVLKNVGEYQLAREFLLYAIGVAEQSIATDEYALGVLAVLLDDVKDANDHFERCLELEPDSFFCRFYLVRTLAVAGDFEKAQSHLQYMNARLGGENIFYVIANSLYKVATGESDALSFDVGDQFFPPFYRGSVLLGINCDVEKALVEWEKSLQSGSFVISMLRPFLAENWILSGKHDVCSPDEILSRPEMQIFLAKMGIDEAGHRIIRQRALGLAGALGIDLKSY